MTYHGVLAPAAKWRELIVPRSPSSADGTHGEERHGPNSDTAPTANARQPTRATRSTGPELMLRASSIDVLNCPHCGGLRELIAFLNDGLVVLPRSLAASGLPTEPPRLAPARAPPEFGFESAE